MAQTTFVMRPRVLASAVKALELVEGAWMRHLANGEPGWVNGKGVLIAQTPLPEFGDVSTTFPEFPVSVPQLDRFVDLMIVPVTSMLTAEGVWLFQGYGAHQDIGSGILDKIALGMLIPSLQSGTLLYMPSADLYKQINQRGEDELPYDPFFMRWEPYDGEDKRLFARALNYLAVELAHFDEPKLTSI